MSNKLMVPVSTVNVQAFFEKTAPIMLRLDDLVQPNEDMTTLRPIVEEIINRALVPVRFKAELIDVFTEALDAYAKAVGVEEFLTRNAPEGA